MRLRLAVDATLRALPAGAPANGVIPAAQVDAMEAVGLIIDSICVPLLRNAETVAEYKLYTSMQKMIPVCYK